MAEKDSIVISQEQAATCSQMGYLRGEKNNQTQSVNLDGPSAEGAKAELSLARRRWSGGRGESTGGGRAVVRAR